MPTDQSVPQEPKSPTAVVNVSDPNANMYGCLPCPKCGSEFRFTAKARYTPALKDKTVVVCDNCMTEEEVHV